MWSGILLNLIAALIVVVVVLLAIIITLLNRLSVQLHQINMDLDKNNAWARTIHQAITGDTEHKEPKP